MLFGSHDHRRGEFARQARSPNARRLFALCAVLTAHAPLYASAAENVHIVAKGQTLGRIAKRYHVSVRALREANDLSAGERIQPGIALRIPNDDVVDRSAEAKVGAAAKHRGSENFTRAPKRPGVVSFVRGADHADVRVLSRHGRLVGSSLTQLSKLLHDPSGARTSIDPHLATFIGMVSNHFGGRTLNVVSGYRPYDPGQYTPHSKHNTGHAIDFNIEGVPNTVLRDFCRTFRNAGVGYYPNGTFVHLDAREGRVTWTDYSHAGEAPRYERPEGGSPTASPTLKDGDPADHGEPGSQNTQAADPQVPEMNRVNASSADPKLAQPKMQGPKAPTLSESTPIPPPSTPDIDGH